MNATVSKEPLLSANIITKLQCLPEAYLRATLDRNIHYIRSWNFMAKKRKNTSSVSEGPHNKRPRAFAANLEEGDSTSLPFNIQSRVDPTYGQRGAFPGLDIPSGEDELFQGPANDGMEYLRLVR